MFVVLFSVLYYAFGFYGVRGDLEAGASVLLVMLCSV